MKLFLVTAAAALGASNAFTLSSFTTTTPVAHRSSIASSTGLCMKYKVAVVGGGPSGACAADVFAKEKNIETYLIERKLDNAKPCGGAIPLCMIGEFNLPETVVDRKVCLKRFLISSHPNHQNISTFLLQPFQSDVLYLGSKNESHFSIWS